MTLSAKDIKAASTALDEFERILADWEKARCLDFAILYFNGHLAVETGRGTSLTLEVKKAVVRYYREQVYVSLKKLESLHVNTTALLPDDWE